MDTWMWLAEQFSPGGTWLPLVVSLASAIYGAVMAIILIRGKLLANRKLTLEIDVLREKVKRGSASSPTAEIAATPLGDADRSDERADEEPDRSPLEADPPLPEPDTSESTGAIVDAVRDLPMPDRISVASGLDVRMPLRTFATLLGSAVLTMMGAVWAISEWATAAANENAATLEERIAELSNLVEHQRHASEEMARTLEASRRDSHERIRHLRVSAVRDCLRESGVVRDRWRAYWKQHVFQGNVLNAGNSDDGASAANRDILSAVERGNDTLNRLRGFLTDVLVERDPASVHETRVELAEQLLMVQYETRHALRHHKIVDGEGLTDFDLLVGDFLDDLAFQLSRLEL